MCPVRYKCYASPQRILAAFWKSTVRYDRDKPSRKEEPSNGSRRKCRQNTRKDDDTLLPMNSDGVREYRATTSTQTQAEDLG